MNFTLGIVDDDEAILYTVRAMADSLGWPIRTTTAAEESLNWVRLGLVDILLIDYHMPMMSGLEVVRRARAFSARTVLLALTVEESPKVARELLLAGADDFVSKPIRLADFASRISLHAELLHYRQEVADGQKGLSESTARRVYDTFAERPVMTAQEAAAQCGLAYPTVHRYLEYLVRKGTLQRRQSEDGRSGRPHSLYERTGSTLSDDEERKR